MPKSKSRFLAIRLRRRLRPWQRAAIAILSVPPLAVGLLCAGFYVNIHRQAAAMSSDQLPIQLPPTAGQRLLILAPHCDDETLGAGGLIAQAWAAGIPVTVAFLTNGDGFRAAAARTLGKVNPQPADFVRFAEKRQSEATAALAELGVSADRIVFLGYPDRGLKSMWESNWSTDHPFRSYYTRCDRSPYRRTFSPGTPYSGQALVADLVRLMDQVRPTDIYVTHPADDHADHSAAAAFAQAALDCVEERIGVDARSIRLRYYLIHRGDWPLPQGRHTDAPLVPPAGMETLDTTWEQAPLGPTARNAKSRALACYGSQMALCDRFLTSFIRRNELFGALPDRARTARDARSDDLMRFATAAADITGISVIRAKAPHQDTATLRLRLRGTTSSQVHYTLFARGGADRARRSGFVTLPLTLPPTGTTALSVDVPLRQLGIEPSEGGTIWVGAETRLGERLLVDKVGYRSFFIAPEAD